MFDNFRNFSGNVHQVCSSTTGLCIIIFAQSDDIALHSRSQLRLKLDTFYLYYNSNISDSIQAMAFKLGMTVDLCMAYVICSCWFR